MSFINDDDDDTDANVVRTEFSLVNTADLFTPPPKSSCKRRQRRRIDDDDSVDMSTLSWCVTRMLCLVLALAIVAFLGYEGTKAYVCYTNTCDLTSKARGAVRKDVCSEDSEIVRYGVFFNDACNMAQETIDLGEHLGTWQCFARSHAVYNVLAFEHSSFNYALGGALVAIVFFAIYQYRRYSSERSTIESNERIMMETQRTNRHFMGVLERRMGNSRALMPAPPPPNGDGMTMSDYYAANSRKKADAWRRATDGDLGF